MSMHPTRNYFAEFKGNNRVFVETGTYRGDGVYLAVQAGYEAIFSLDIDMSNNSYRKLIGARCDVCFFEIDSAKGLGDIINGIDEPITFWLDAHWQFLDGHAKGENPFPLLKELEHIASHPVKSHTIIIDDMMFLTHPEVTGWSRKTIHDALLRINPAYKFYYLPNPIIDNILVACL